VLDLAAGYALALGVTAIAVALRAALAPMLDDTAPLIVLLIAPIVAALYGGFGPGMLATVACALVGEALFVPPYGSFVPPNPAEAARLGVFIVEGTLVSWLAHTRSRAFATAARHHTRLEATQARVAERERRLREVLEASPSAMLVVDRDGRILLVNREAERVFRASREELLRASVEDLVPDDVRQRHPGLRAGYHREPAARPMGAGRELLGRALDGNTFPVEIALNPLGDGHSEVLASVIDISERRAAEAALLDTERQFRVLFESAPVAYYVIEPRTGRFLTCNAKAAERLGYSVDEIEHLTLADIDAAHTAAALPVMLDRVARGEPLHLETIHRDRHGRLHDVLISSHAMEVQGMRVILAAAQDITERKRMEDALKLADRHKDDFLAMLAHELRNPLAPLSMGLALLLRNPHLDERDRNTVEMGVRQTRQLTHLVNDLLEVARISRGKVTLARETASMQVIARTALESVQPLMEEKRQVLRVAMPDTPLHLHADPARMQQVIENLLHNASKYTPPEGRIELTMRTEDDQIVTCISDDGMGIDPADLPQLFTPFTQVAAPLDRSQGGLGLGLALVKRLVEMHGGRVEAHSAGRGKGARFCVSLAWARDAAPQPTHAVRPGASEEPVRRRVLVVDDNHDAADTLGELLDLEGHEVTIAYDGHDALARADAVRPEIGILDIGLPGMDGYELARRLRETPHGREMVLAALTGYGQPADREFAKKAGFDHHLLKPVDVGALLALLH
jgi:PAS domain S-box-containing protein